jgi:hypothetical protein
MAGPWPTMKEFGFAFTVVQVFADLAPLAVVLLA